MNRPGHRPLLWLLLLSLVIGWTRYHYLRFPSSTDPASFAVIAHEMLHGKRLYVDVFDHKAPGVYFVDAVAEKLIGYGDWQIWLLGTTAAVATLFALYWAGAGLWGCVFWTVIQADAYMQANEPFVEVWLALLAVLGYGAVVRKRYWITAAIVVAGCLFKPTFIIIGGAYVACALAI